jgi:hypothetical protein
MKIIDTSAVTTNGWLPLLGNFGGSGINAFATAGSTGSMAGIDFIQQAYTECLNAIAEFAVADPTVATIMYGCTKIFPITEFSFYTAEQYGVTPGWVYYNGELFFVQGAPVPIITLVTGQYINANIVTSYSTADAATFSNGATNNIHQIRFVEFSISTTRNTTGSGSTLPDYDFWVNAGNNSNSMAPASAVINNWISTTWDTFMANYTALIDSFTTSAVTPTLESGWSVTGLSASNPVQLYKAFGRVYLSGEVTYAGSANSSILFYLPTGYRPELTEELFAVPDTLQAFYPDGGHDAYMRYIWIRNDGAVTFIGNSSGDGEDSVAISLSGINFLAAFPLEEELMLT